MLLLTCLLLFGLFNVSQCLSYNSSVNLTTDVLTGYNSRQRPLLEQSDTLNVTVSFSVVSIRELDEVAGKFSIVATLSMTWRDEIINWAPLDYDGALKIDLKLSDIWYPKLLLVNPYSKLADLGQDWMMLSVTYSGETIFEPISLFESTCSVDVTYYPYDIQECNLVFSAFAFTGVEMRLSPSSVRISNSVSSGQWNLETADVEWLSGGLIHSDRLIYTFKVKRKPLFVVINIILPIVLMATINILVFILPAESGERLSFSVTVLLALAVYLTIVGENLPNSSEPMSVMSYYLIGTLLISILITVITIFNLGIYHRHGEVSQCYRSLARRILFTTCRRNTPVKPKMAFVTDELKESIGQSESDSMRNVTWQDVSFAIDRIFLILFSLASILVNTVFLSVLKNNS